MTTTVLAIDASTAIASVALVRAGHVVAEDQRPSEQRHDHVLLTRIDEILKRSAVALSDVDLLAVGLGPGAFGGLRVSLATVKGLALGTGIATVGVCSLHALAHGAPVHARFAMPLIDAYRGELYAALYARDGEHWVERHPPFAAPPSAVVARLRPLCDGAAPAALGNGLVVHGVALSAAWPALVVGVNAATCMPEAVHVASLAVTRRTTHGPDAPAALLPIYIRDADAKLPTHPLTLSDEPATSE